MASSDDLEGFEVPEEDPEPAPEGRRSGLPEVLATLVAVSAAVSGYLSPHDPIARGVSLLTGVAAAGWLLYRLGAHVWEWRSERFASKHARAERLASVEEVQRRTQAQLAAEEEWRAEGRKRIVDFFDFLKKAIGRDLNAGLYRHVNLLAFPQRTVPMDDQLRAQAEWVEFGRAADVIDSLPSSGELPDLMRLRDLAARTATLIAQVLRRLMVHVGGDPQTIAARTELVHEFNRFLDRFDALAESEPRLTLAKFRGIDRLDLNQQPVAGSTVAVVLNPQPRN